MAQQKHADFDQYYLIDDPKTRDSFQQIFDNSRDLQAQIDYYHNSFSEKEQQFKTADQTTLTDLRENILKTKAARKQAKGNKSKAPAPVRVEACASELASKQWFLSEEICRSFCFVTFNI